MKKLLFLLLFMSVTFILSAQIENIQSSTINQNAGLISNDITSIYQDSKGFIWMGSRNGLTRYDGHNFKVYKYDALDTTTISSNYIFGIYEDRSGNFWVTTDKGLNKFNRKTEKFTRYLHHPFAIDWLVGMFPGRKNNLWFSMWESRILKFDIEKEQFSQFIPPTAEADELFESPITTLFENETKELWVGTWNKGLFRYSLNENEKLIARYSTKSNTGHRISGDTITSIFKSSAGDLWVGTTYGLNKITNHQNNKSPETITHYLYNPENPNSISSNAVFSISEDNRGNLWMKTLNGVNMFNSNTEQFKAWKHNAQRGNGTVTYFNRRTLHIDNNDIIWFGLQGEGVTNLVIHRNKFNLIQYNPNNPNSLSSNDISSIYQDNTGELWVGTWFDGLNRRLPGKKGQESSGWIRYMHDADDPSSIGSNSLRTVLRDKKGVVWIGTMNGGLNKFIDDGNGKGRFKQFLFDTADWQYQNTVDLILEDKADNLWLGTPIGLHLFNRYTEEFYPFYFDINNPDSLNFGVSSFAEAPSGAIWYSCWDEGLYKTSPPFIIKDSCVTASTISYKYGDHLPKEIGDLVIRSILVPKVYKETKLWVATEGGGLFALKEAENSNGKTNEYFINYTVSDGLCDNFINGIEEDKYGNLWLSTSNGLSRFNPESETFINYYAEEGLETNYFEWLANYRSPSGELFYRNNGLLSFFPDSLYNNKKIPPVYITSIIVNNKNLVVGDQSILKVSPSETNEITLTHEENNLSIEYAAINYIKPENNRYKYKLEGLEEEWINAGTKSEASYQGLHPGKYTFRVIASNNDGVWNNKGTSLNINIKPPWWRTFPAIIVYILLFGMALYGFIKYRDRKLIRQKKRLEEKVKERTEELQEVNVLLKEQKEELEQQKEELQQTLEFLKETQTQLVQSEKMASVGQLTAGIAHEINNPVNYISAGIDSLKTSVKEIGHILDLYTSITKENFDEKIKMIREEEEKIDMAETRAEIRNLIKSITNGTKRTTEIVKGLRTFSRLDENEIKQADIHEGIDLTLVMLHNKYKHHVTIEKNYGDLPMIECFPGKLNQVFMNILSNAIEAIPEKGTIFIKTWNDPSTNHVFISIKDDGEGMSESTRSNIFNPFFTTKEVGKGTGLGLSISHGIIEQHKGKIEVKSQPGKGTEFIITLPDKQNEQ